MAPTIEPKSVSYHEGFEIGEVENPSKDNNSVDDYWEEPEDSEASEASDLIHSTTEDDSTIADATSKRNSITGSSAAEQIFTPTRTGILPISDLHYSHVRTRHVGQHRRDDDSVKDLTNDTTNRSILTPHSTFNAPETTDTRTATAPTATSTVLPFMQQWWKVDKSSMIFLSIVLGIVGLSLVLLAIGYGLGFCVNLNRYNTQRRQKREIQKKQKRESALEAAMWHGEGRERSGADFELGDVHQPELEHSPGSSDTSSETTSKSTK